MAAADTNTPAVNRFADLADTEAVKTCDAARPTKLFLTGTRTFVTKGSDVVNTMADAEVALWDHPCLARRGIWALIGYPREGAKRFVGELLGKEVPQNQFGTGRVVLFGRHCGCDYCGVISCEVLKQGT